MTDRYGQTIPWIRTAWVVEVLLHQKGSLSYLRAIVWKNLQNHLTISSPPKLLAFVKLWIVPIQTLINYLILLNCDSVLNEFTSASQDEVRKLISSFPSNSCDLDSLPTWMFKIHLDTLLLIITKIANLSLDTACFPSTFKNAFVTPLLKKLNLDANNFKNYRPVSNLNFVPKIIEKVVASRLSICQPMNYMSHFNLHTKSIMEQKLFW